ncbi:MAG TPA: metallophosphoesterase family protein [Terriglobales bacterium]|jgi:predicted phosphodiesterase|nr:metallophosphoesterase family protein [Terriglobales bacterium]
MQLRFAAIADIHGNIWALEAVLADIRSRSVDLIVNLGDHLYGPLDPIRTADRLIVLDLPSISGNQDRELIASTPAQGTLQENRGALREEHRTWLGKLPSTLLWPEQDVLLCHGTPFADDVYLLEQVHAEGVSLATPEKILSLLGGVSHSLILCGHSHVPRTVTLPQGSTIVNPGSVGLQAYTDDLPLPHAMQTGSPHARYAILTRHKHGWQVEHISVVYDWNHAAEVAARNGRADWGHCLKTGRA